MKPRLTEKAVRDMLARECRAAGSQAAWADLHNLSPAYVSDVINGRRSAGDRVAAALDLRRVVLFEAQP